MGDVITDARKFRKGWRGGLPETPCGSGSKLANTVQQRAFISDVIRRHEIKTIADIGAGDLNWLKHMDLCGAKYTAYDLVPRAPGVVEFDVVNQVPPRVDLLLVLWVLNHLTAEQSARAFGNIKASRATWMLFTDRPTWYDDWPAVLRDLPYSERLILNKKRDAVLLVPLGHT